MTENLRRKIGTSFLVRVLSVAFACLTLYTIGVCQTTSVTLQVTDADAQTWNNGTWSAALIPSAGITGPFFILGTATPVPNQQQAGALNGTGSATLTLNSNNQIAPANSLWAITVCPNATSPCFTQNQSIQGATQTVNLSPPAIRITLTGVPYRVLAYLDLEISNPVSGSLYYNVTSTCMKLFSLASWTCLGVGGAGTVTSVGGLAPLFTVSNPTTTPTFSPISQSGNTVFGNCTNGAAIPNFCSITGLMLGLTTNGDIPIIAGGVLSRLAQGSNGQFLGVSGGVLGYFTPAAPLSSLTGGTQGFGTVGTSTGALAPDGSTILVTGFKNGTGLNSPCQAILNAVAAAPSLGSTIDAGGLTANTGLYSGQGFTNTGCGLESNIFGGFLGGQAAVTQLNAGQIKLGPGALDISLVPAEYGTCITQNNGGHTNPTCVSLAGGPAPMVAPSAVIVMPNGTLGMIGRGRGYQGLRNTTLRVCTGAGAPSSGCLAPQNRLWAISAISVTNIAATNVRIGAGGANNVHRKYMTVTVTPNNFATQTIVGNGTVATVTMTGLISGQLSGGQTVNISGVTPAGFNNAAAVVCASSLNGGQPTASCGPGPVTVTTGGTCSVTAPCTQFTYLNATNATASVQGTVAVSANFVPGEYIQLQNVGNVGTGGGGVSVDDGTWRVCATQANVKNGVTGDNNCPIASPNGNSNPTQFAVVGTSADSTLQTHAADSVACAATCGGNVVGSIPVIDLGDPQNASASGLNNQFAMQAQYMGVLCNDTAGATPSCSGIRNFAGNEQSGASFFEVGGTPLWGVDVHGNIQQNSFNWGPIEVLGQAATNTAATVTAFSSPTVTLTTVSGNYPSGFSPGQAIIVSSCSAAGNNGLWTVASGGTGTSALTYADAGGSTPASGCQAAPASCFPGTTGFVLADTGPRLLTGFTTVAPGPCAQAPVAGMYIDINQGPSKITGGHTEAYVFSDLCGANLPCQGVQMDTLGGPPNPAGNVTDGPYQGNPPTGNAAHAIAGAFPSQINGTNSAFSGDYCFLNQKRSATVVTTLQTVVDDFFNYSSSDAYIGINCVDTNGNTTPPVHIVSSGSVPLIYNQIGSSSNCSSGVSPAVCGSSSSGNAAIPTGTNPTLQINTTAVTANSQIQLSVDETLGTKLGVTCNTTLTTLPNPIVTARTAGTSFTVQLNATTTTNPVCISYTIIN